VALAQSSAFALFSSRALYILRPLRLLAEAGAAGLRPAESI
jgi:hypothetical protein